MSHAVVCIVATASSELVQLYEAELGLWHLVLFDNGEY